MGYGVIMPSNVEKIVDHNGIITYVTSYYNKNKRLDNPNGPARISTSQYGITYKKEWFINGKPSRDNDLPTVEQFYENGKLFAEIWIDENFGIHRLTGPAYIVYDENGTRIITEWWFHSKQLKVFPDTWPITLDESVKWKLINE